MTVQLTPEQERRIQAMIHGGAYETVQEVVDAAIAAVEDRARPGFEGTENQLEALLLTGMDSPEMPDEEFWRSVDHSTDSMLAEHEARILP